MGFPKDFLWGAATSAYQIEGGWQADGKAPSIWDDFCHRPGHIQRDETGDIACDHYHRYREDVSLMKELGISSYRFSINWPRVISNGKVNKAGLDFYDRLVDALLEAGIEPCVTLYHWELPLALHERGGWLNPDTTTAFGALAQCVAERLRGRVKRYITLNEPQCSTSLGYGSGIHAPGCRTDALTQMAVAHHLLLAHGYGVQAIRAADSGCQVGIASTGRVCYPARPEALEQAREAMFRCDDSWAFTHHWYLDPVILGHYPQGDWPEPMRGFLSRVAEADLKAIAQPLDFLAVNLYNGDAIHSEGQVAPRSAGAPRTALRWAVAPEAMGYGLTILYDRYGLPLLISENGQSCNDRIFLDGKVHDPDRIDYMHRYLLSMERAMEAGVPVLGYYHWSLMDNFEWSSGYDDRFGLIYVDYANGCRRIPKDSYYWYQGVIRTGRLPNLK